MKSLKFFMVLFVVMVSGIAFAGVTMVGVDKVMPAKDFGTNVKAKGKYVIAVVVKSAAIPVWESHIIAAKKAGKDLGVKVVDYAPAKADNVEEQKRILEDIITAGIDLSVGTMMGMCGMVGSFLCQKEGQLYIESPDRFIRECKIILPCIVCKVMSQVIPV